GRPSGNRPRPSGTSSPPTRPCAAASWMPWSNTSSPTAGSATAAGTSPTRPTGSARSAGRTKSMLTPELRNGGPIRMSTILACPPATTATPAAKALSADRQRLFDHREAARQDRERRLRCTQALADLAAQAGARYAPTRVSLDNYVVRHPGQRQTIDRLRALAERLPEAVRNGEPLVLFGTPGTGKDHLLAALLYVAAGRHGLRVQWTSGLRLYQAFRDAI